MLPAASPLDKWNFHFLLAVVALAPLPFGAVHNWAWSLLGLAVGGLVAVWGWGRLKEDPSAQPVAAGPRHILFPLICFAALAAWIVFQALPGLPAGLAHPLWRDAAESLGEPIAGRISLDPQAAIPALIHLGTYVGIFWLGLHYGRNPGWATRAVGAIAASGMLYALYGLVMEFFGSRWVLWLAKTAYRGDVTATFINRNNYATFAGLGWVCLLALLFRGFMRQASGGSGIAVWFHALVVYVEKRGGPVLLGAPLLAGALLASHSRGGLLATLLGTVVFCLALQVNASHRREFARRFSVVVLVLATFAALAGGSVVAGRLAGTKEDGDRLTVYRLALGALENRPLSGTGAGTFEEAFRMARTPGIVSTFAQAHNSYLETALELGIPALILAIAGLGWITAVNWAGARNRHRDAVYPCLGLAATTLVGFHACVDFSIQIPAVAATYALILGVSTAQSWSTRPKAVAE